MQNTQNIGSNVGKGRLQLGGSGGSHHSGIGATIQGGQQVLTGLIEKKKFPPTFNVSLFKYQLLKGGIQTSQLQNVQSDVGKAYGKVEGNQVSDSKLGFGGAIQSGNQVLTNFFPNE